MFNALHVYYSYMFKSKFSNYILRNKVCNTKLKYIRYNHNSRSLSRAFDPILDLDGGYIV